MKYYPQLTILKSLVELTRAQILNIQLVDIRMCVCICLLETVCSGENDSLCSVDFRQNEERGLFRCRQFGICYAYQARAGDAVSL